MLCFAVALLTSHFSFEQIPKLVEGDIATQDIEATAEFDYIDDEAWAARKLEVASEQPAIYELDVSKQVTLEHRLIQPFPTPESIETLDPPVKSNNGALENIQIEFEKALGLTLRSGEEQFIDAAVRGTATGLPMLQDSMHFISSM